MAAPQRAPDGRRDANSGPAPGPREIRPGSDGGRRPTSRHPPAPPPDCLRRRPSGPAGSTWSAGVAAGRCRRALRRTLFGPRRGGLACDLAEPSARPCSPHPAGRLACDLAEPSARPCSPHHAGRLAYDIAGPGGRLTCDLAGPAGRLACDLAGSAAGRGLAGPAAAHPGLSACSRSAVLGADPAGLAASNSAGNSARDDARSGDAPACTGPCRTRSARARPTGTTTDSASRSSRACRTGALNHRPERAPRGGIGPCPAPPSTRPPPLGVGADGGEAGLSPIRSCPSRPACGRFGNDSTAVRVWFSCARNAATAVASLVRFCWAVVK